MRVRLRPKHSDAELARLYATPHDHTRWADHLLRVDVTASVAKWLTAQYDCQTAADLSCGDGWIVGTLELPQAYRGDLAPGWDITGPIEDTINDIPEVDLFVCSETIEHLDDPDATLRGIAGKASTLVVSTPIDESGTGNPEHYWGWGVADVQEMLRATGWDIVVTTAVTLPGWTYDYQIHGCRRSDA